MFLNTKLKSRKKNIKVTFIGCGKFVSMFLAQYNHLQKIVIDSIVDINIDNAKKNCLPPSEYWAPRSTKNRATFWLNGPKALC